jgi:hypothetical protein
VPEHPRLKLAAPWGAAVVLGLVPVLYLPESTPYRGALQVVQVDSQGSLEFVAGLRTLTAKARARQAGFWEEVPMFFLCQRAPLGWAELVGCENQPQRRRWAWRLANPTRGAQPIPPPGQPNPTLFERP